MRYFYDLEFLEDGHTIEPVSIGIAAADGRTYYAVNRSLRWERVANSKFTWVRENVWPHLPLTAPHALSIHNWHPDVKDKIVIAGEVRAFLLGDTSDGQVPHIELWGDYPAYDHVALCQLWGRMVDLPEGIPMRTNCIVQYAEMLGVSEKQFPQQDPKTQHHALCDALHIKKVFESLHPEMAPKSSSRGVQVKLPRKGEEGGAPAASKITTGRTWGGRAVRDLPHVFPES